MTASNTRAPAPEQPASSPLAPIPTRRTALSRRLPWLTGAAAVVVAAGLYALADASLALSTVIGAALFTIATYAVSRALEGRRRAADRLLTTLVTAAFLLALLPLVSVLVTVVGNGVERLDADFFTHSMRGIVGEGGGIYHALMGTLVITLLATAISVPIGLLAAIYLVEYGGRGRLARALTFFVDVMTGIPSIVAGLFAYALFALIFGPGVRMGIAGAVALSVLMIPIVVRSSEEMLKLVPDDLREAAYALGVPKWRTIIKVVLPTAVAGIATGITLAIARIVGETAPLLIAVGTTTSTNLNPFSSRMETLPIFTYYQYASPGVPRDPYIDRAWAAALVLIIIVMTLNLVARVIYRLFAPKAGG